MLRQTKVKNGLLQGIPGADPSVPRSLHLTGKVSEIALALEPYPFRIVQAVEMASMTENGM